MTYTSLYGQVLGRADVQNAAISTLQAWIVPWLAEVERQEGLAARTIPAPGGSYPPVNTTAIRAGLDASKWQGDSLPCVIVGCQPTGDPEHTAPSTYAQWFELTFWSIFEGQDEPGAWQVADWYGKALQFLAGPGGLGTRVDWATGATVPFSSRTIMVGTPRTEFPDPTTRRLAQSTAVFHTFVDQIVDGAQGPRVPPHDPYTDPGKWPTITSVDITLQSRNPLGVPSGPTGVNVTDSTGHIIVSE